MYICSLGGILFIPLTESMYVVWNLEGVSKLLIKKKKGVACKFWTNDMPESVWKISLDIKKYVTNGCKCKCCCSSARFLKLRAKWEFHIMDFLY